MITNGERYVPIMPTKGKTIPIIDHHRALFESWGKAYNFESLEIHGDCIHFTCADGAQGTFDLKTGEFVWHKASVNN